MKRDDSGMREVNYVAIDQWRVYRSEVSWRDGRIVAVRETGAEDPALGYLIPGFVDAHVHIESAMLPPAEFGRIALRHGTLAVVTDPHEIGNVHGVEGIDFMLADSEGLPLSVFVMASSCVPATHMSTSGAVLGRTALEALAGHPRVLGLAEVMNFPGVIAGIPDMLGKLEAFTGRPVDGHAPGVRGMALNAYVAAGPQSDHECTTVDEAREKLARGLWVLVREATNARNLETLLPLLQGPALWRTALCTDDRQPSDLLGGQSPALLLCCALNKGGHRLNILFERFDELIHVGILQAR